jgi:hypothetical protein
MKAHVEVTIFSTLGVGGSFLLSGFYTLLLFQTDMKSLKELYCWESPKFAAKWLGVFSVWYLFLFSAQSSYSEWNSCSLRSVLPDKGGDSTSLSLERCFSLCQLYCLVLFHSEDEMMVIRFTSWVNIINFGWLVFFTKLMTLNMKLNI